MRANGVTCQIVSDGHGRLRNRTAQRNEPWQVALKIRGDQIVRTSASANIHPCGSGTDQVTVAIERIQKPRLIGAGIRLNSPQCIFRYEE